MRVRKKWYGFASALRNIRQRSKKSVEIGLFRVAKNMRKLMKDRPRGTASPPGTAPFAHRKKRGVNQGRRKRLKDTIKPAKNSGGMSGVVGTMVSWADQLGELHDKGGTQYVSSVWWLRKNAKKTQRSKRIKKGGERGYSAESTSSKSAGKKERGLRGMQPDEVEAIRRWYMRKRGYSSTDAAAMASGKKTLARYPKRPFTRVALIMTLKTISASLAGR